MDERGRGKGGVNARIRPGLVVRGGGLVSRRTQGGRTLSQLAIP